MVCGHRPGVLRAAYRLWERTGPQHRESSLTSSRTRSRLTLHEIRSRTPLIYYSVRDDFSKLSIYTRVYTPCINSAPSRHPGWAGIGRLRIVFHRNSINSLTLAFTPTRQCEKWRKIRSRKLRDGALTVYERGILIQNPCTGNGKPSFHSIHTEVRGDRISTVYRDSCLAFALFVNSAMKFFFSADSSASFNQLSMSSNDHAIPESSLVADSSPVSYSAVL